MRMSEAARQPRGQRLVERGRDASRSPAVSPLRSRSPLLSSSSSPFRNPRTPAASPLRGGSRGTPHGSPFPAKPDDFDRKGYVMREAAATAVRYHAFLASTTDRQQAGSFVDPAGSTSSTDANRITMGSPRRNSTVLGAKETRELLYGEATHEAKEIEQPATTPSAAFWKKIGRIQAIQGKNFASTILSMAEGQPESLEGQERVGLGGGGAAPRLHI